MERLDTLVAGMRSAGAAFPDERRGDVRHSIADIEASAFPLFFMQSASVLSAYQRVGTGPRRERSFQRHVALIGAEAHR